ncbi:MAG: T9SS type A sorting domain-containing protein [Flavobacteriales bacterium]|nr:T9SS type A sorting domain-containing protein [Flavobacteriales bacterium]
MRFSLTLLFATGLSISAFSQSYEERRQQHLLYGQANVNDHTNVILGYNGQPLIQEYLDSIYSVMLTKSTIDFDIQRLVRAMFLSNGDYDSQIVSNLNLVPYWVNDSDTLHGYWSENHTCMWMSADWLIHERTGRPIDATLEQRLKHYLHLKVDYGFYEFFSSTYFPYTLCGLLNLADFAEDVEIRGLAEQATRRLLTEVLLVVNDEGAFYPAAGRNYTSKYSSAFGQNHSAIVYLLTGLGPEPQEATQGSSFLATSDIDFSDVGTTWTAEVDTVLSIGHTLEEGFVINQELSHADRVMMQWSCGGYFHPLVVEETVGLLEDSNMWGHVDFALLAPLAGFPPDYYPTLAENLSAASMSTVISGQDVHIFKNNGVTLASIHDFHKGKVGFQQWPVVAGVGTAAVYPASGPATPEWDTRNRDNANEHLPYVGQSANVALIMYWPETMPEILPFNNKDVTLHWPDDAFDEVTENGNWLLGRQGENYVAVRRACTGQIEGLWGCETPTPEVPGQTWVLIVGNEQMHGSFSSFSNLIDQAQFEELWIQPTGSGDGTYSASISFNGNDVSYDWTRLGTSAVGELQENGNQISIYPNPASDVFTIEVPKGMQETSITVTNALGQQVYRKGSQGEGRVSIGAQDWPAGIYHITLDSDSERLVGKLVKQ